MQIIYLACVIVLRGFVIRLLLPCRQHAKNIVNFSVSDKRHVAGCCPWMLAIRNSVGRGGNRLTLAVQKAPVPAPEDQKQSEPPMLSWCPAASYLPAAGPGRCSQPGVGCGLLCLDLFYSLKRLMKRPPWALETRP